MKKMLSVVVLVMILVNVLGSIRVLDAKESEKNLHSSSGKMWTEKGEYILLNACADDEAGNIKITWENDEIVSAQVYTRYNEEYFSLQEETTEKSTAIRQPEKYVDVYIIATMFDGQVKKSNIVTFQRDNIYFLQARRDADQDGLDDGYEIRDTHTDYMVWDTDGDGFGDGYEVCVLHTNPLTNTKDEDFDKDGISNLNEQILKSNPYLNDTDFDGISDYADSQPLENNTEIVVKNLDVSKLTKNLFSQNEIWRSADGTEHQFTVDILSNNLVWSKTGALSTLFIYDFETKKLLAQITHDETSQVYKVVYFYYENDRLSSVNRDGNVFHMDYTTNGQLESLKKNGNSLYRNQYKNNNLIQTTYANGNIIQYEYDEKDNITNIKNNGELLHKWKYEKGMPIEYHNLETGLDEYISYTDHGDVKQIEDNAGFVIRYENDCSQDKEIEKTFYKKNQVTRQIERKVEYNILTGEKTYREKYFNEDDSETIILNDGEVQVQQTDNMLNKEKENRIMANCYKGSSKNREQTIQHNQITLETKDKTSNVLRDKMGNVISIDGATLEWTGGFHLKSYYKDGIKTTYFYDGKGNRIKKDVNGRTTFYGVENGQIIWEQTGNQLIWYYYDESGNIIAMEFEGHKYLYEKDKQGNIIGIKDNFGNSVVEYKYDEQGQLMQINGSVELGLQNKFRFGSAYYDEESSLYYSAGRYYDCSINNFLNDNIFYETELTEASTYLMPTANDSDAITITEVVKKGTISITGANEFLAWNSACNNFNCYSYAIRKTDKVWNPGQYANLYTKQTYASLTQLTQFVLADLKKWGHSAEIVYSPTYSNLNRNVIAFRLKQNGSGENLDYHFMRRIGTVGPFLWYHKPGKTAVLKFVREITSSVVWPNESFDMEDPATMKGTWYYYYNYIPYNSSIAYVAYY